MENDIKLDDKLITEEISKGNIKRCPKCGQLTSKISGCNYLKCTICKIEWCWQCVRVKYKPINNGECCNDKSHNSH